MTTNGAAGSVDTTLSEAIKMPDAVSDTTLPKASISGEYTSSNSSHVAAIVELVVVGIGDDMGNPPLPQQIFQPCLLGY